LLRKQRKTLKGYFLPHPVVVISELKATIKDVLYNIFSSRWHDPPSNTILSL